MGFLPSETYTKTKGHHIQNEKRTVAPAPPARGHGGQEVGRRGTTAPSNPPPTFPSVGLGSGHQGVVEFATAQEVRREEKNAKLELQHAQMLDVSSRFTYNQHGLKFIGLKFKLNFIPTYF